MGTRNNIILQNKQLMENKFGSLAATNNDNYYKRLVDSSILVSQPERMSRKDKVY